jgi:hypothetical protein
MLLFIRLTLVIFSCPAQGWSHGPAAPFALRCRGHAGILLRCPRALRGGGLAEDLRLSERLGMVDQSVSVAADAPLAKLDHSILGAVRRLADDECAKKVRDLTAKGAHAGWQPTLMRRP